MEFHKKYLTALESDITLTKKKSVLDYLPTPIIAAPKTKEHLPYIQAFSHIISTYPYRYALSGLDSFCLLYTESGSGSLMIDGHPYLLSSNTLVWLDCQKRHKIEVKQSPWTYKVLFLNGPALSFLYQSFLEDYDVLHTLPAASALPELLTQLFMHLQNCNNPAFLQTKLLIDILLELLMEKERILKSEVRIPTYLVEIKESFDRNYQNDFSLDFLEQKYKINKYRICREFAFYFHTSPIRYLNQKRIQKAKNILLYTDKKINEIGRLVGFENSNHFIRLFKQQTGVTPLIYRKHPPALSLYN